MNTIDLRSDTVTQPTAGMLDAMMQARVGDDVYKEDPTVNELEQRIADYFGMETALYFPTGTMANQAAIKLHTQPGDQLICDHYAHVYNYEGGGVSFNSGVSCKLIQGDRGMITASQIKNAINPPDFYHSPMTRLICIENTTNKGGGACYDLNTIKEIKSLATDNRLGLHLDGARLWNALVATGDDPKEYGSCFDTISVCLSKGLGAPMGSVLIGNNIIMDKAMRIRKILGGGMRQLGYMAAAGIYALDHHMELLQYDHLKARELAQALQKVTWVSRVEEVQTNIIIFYVSDIQRADNFFNSYQIKYSDMGDGKYRLVTHYCYTNKMHEFVINQLKNDR